MGQIFISYRRDTDAGYVRALLNEMKHTFGDRQTFLDTESIEAGTDFAATIEQAIQACEVVLVMIGPRWLKVTDRLGGLRLRNPDDFVRLEIVTAFKHSIPVLPILIEDAVMPTEAELPEALDRLARLQAVRLSNTRWDNDIARLFESLERLSEEPRLSRRYLEAAKCANRGHWQDAMRVFETIESERPDFRDVSERLTVFRSLAREVAGRVPAGTGWQQAALRFPILSMLFLSLPPNVLAGLFNFVYNERLIVAPMAERGIRDAESLFALSATLVNGIGFPVGIACLAYLAWPVRRALRQARGAIALTDDGLLSSARRRCLQLGHSAALIGAALWILAGPVYPLLMGAMEFADFAYFVSSLFFCGLIAATYPFFGVAWLCCHVLYLGLLLPGTTSAADVVALDRLERLRWRYLVLAGALPMLAITVGLVLSPLTASHTSSALLGLLGLAGIGGFGLAIWLFRLMQNDLAVLRQLVCASAPVQ